MNRDPKHHEHEHHGHHHAPQENKWRPHRDWRVWVAVLVMLISMGVYVMTLDESLWPRGGNTKPGPAPTDGTGQ